MTDTQALLEKQAELLKRKAEIESDLEAYDFLHQYGVEFYSLGIQKAIVQIELDSIESTLEAIVEQLR